MANLSIIDACSKTAQLTSNKIKAYLNEIRGVSAGIAPLDEMGMIPSTFLPSYVDDVVDAYVVSGATELTSGWLTATSGGTALTPETGKIYVVLATGKTYRWSGTTYAEISASLALGETEGTAYRGDRGKIAYDHSQSSHARTDATAVSPSTNGYVKINGTNTQVYIHPTGAGNNHIPTGGSAGQVLKWSSNGTVTWASDDNAIYSAMTGATASATGTGGLVPYPSAGDQGKLLSGAGTWKNINDVTPTFTQTSSIENIVSGETLTTIFGKLKYYVSELISHLGSTGIHVTTTEKATWNAKQNALTIDTALSTTSTNPIANAAVNLALYNATYVDETALTTAVNNALNS